MSLESAEQLREVRDLIARVFLPPDLEMLVMDYLGVPLVNLVSPGPHPQRVFELLQACDARGWLERLLDGVAEERSQHPEVARVMQRLGRPTTSSMAGGIAVAAAGARSVRAVGTPLPDVAAHALTKRRDEERQALVNQLDDAYARQKRNEDIRESTAEIAREILDLKRRLREGGYLRVGDRLGDDGRYQLIQQVGRGGFAVVWKAKDRRDEIYVAIKVLHANLSGDSHRRERFFRGARMMQRLDHPAVVRVLDPYCEDGGFWYFVMEFVTNGTLHDAVLCKRLAGNDALRQVIRVGEALAKAHAQGMVHRDIKPQNILLDEQLEAKLTDFDLVGAGDTTGGTRTGSLGTAVYAAPECLHRPQDATAHADVFGLGMTAIFCLLGQELTMDTYLDICKDPRETLVVLDCSVPARNVLAHAVARRPEQRFADADEMVTELKRSFNTPMPSASSFLSGCTKEPAAHVGPMAKMFVTDAVRKVCGARPFSRADAPALIAHLAAGIEDNDDRGSFQRAARALLRDGVSMATSSANAPPALPAVAGSVSERISLSPVNLPRSSVPLESQRAELVESATRENEALEELLLELTDLKLEDVELERLDAGSAPGRARPIRGVRDVALAAAGEQLVVSVRRVTARARLTYEPATPGQRPVASTQSWRFEAPLGPIEADELRWYLEKYAIWPGGPFRDRARKIEENLAVWGRQLHVRAMPAGPTDGVLRAWAKVDGHVGRRFSVQVDTRLDVRAREADLAASREAATVLLGLPWELMHDGDSFLFQGAKPTRVRRRLPNTRDLDVTVLTTPIRILLISARPESAACSYIDHRASALPLVDAMKALPGLVDLHVLTPPTLPALRNELDRARRERQPYHVIHFDGHGVYDRRAGLGGLCFEDPEDADKLEGRRHETITTDQLGPLLKDHHIPLLFLQAYQTAHAELASESVASELLQQGLASVVAMSHSVLVATAQRFVTAFYAKLAEGGRVGDAMLEGQRHLKDDTRRGQIFGAGELRLEDWFVPVLFQEQEDPQLFRQTQAKQTVDDFETALQKRLGKLPPEPSTGFVGRSRELLALERLLDREQYAVLRGQGGEGKTALAAEFARWMVRSQRFDRVAFVSVEEHSTARAVLDILGRQLVSSYSVATFADLTHAEQPVVRALHEQRTLLVVDNLESILRPPYLATETPEVLAEDNRREQDAILALCGRLVELGETRLVFTSREVLPAPFDDEVNQRELDRLHRSDAVQLVQRGINEGAAGLSVADDDLEAIEQLADAVHGHARTIALLAPSLRKLGVAATRAALTELLSDMDRRFPGQREKSLFASVELSLRRLSPEARQRARVLGVFHGGVNLNALRVMMEWDKAEVLDLAHELVSVGLATPSRYDHFSLDPALCPYLRSLLDETERDGWTARWVGAMRWYVSFLGAERFKRVEMAATLTLLELPNLMALLAQIAHGSDPEATVDLATTLQTLLQTLGRPHLLARVGEVRDAAAAAIATGWNHARFQASRGQIEDELAGGQLREALTGAEELLEQARAAGEHAYPDADYDVAMACFLLGRVLQVTGGSQRALLHLEEAQQRFEAVEDAQPGHGAARMAAVSLGNRGDCLLYLGRLDEAAAAHDEAIRRAEQRGSERDRAVGKSQLANVRLRQRRYQDALDAAIEARDLFTRLGEPGTVAIAWHQIGLVHREVGRPDEAEDAYRQSLMLEVQLGNVRGQATTLAWISTALDSRKNPRPSAPVRLTARSRWP